MATLAGVISVVSWMVLVSDAVASNNSLGLDYVNNSFVTLRGLRSDVNPPAQYNILTQNFGLESVRMQDPGAFMQVGIIQFNSLSIDPEMCTGPAGQLKLLWEYKITGSGTSYHCGLIGNTNGSRETLRVQRTTSGSGWWAGFVNGSFYINKALGVAQSEEIQIGGELGDGTNTNGNTTVCANYRQWDEPDSVATNCRRFRRDERHKLDNGARAKRDNPRRPGLRELADRCAADSARSLLERERMLNLTVARIVLIGGALAAVAGGCGSATHDSRAPGGTKPSVTLTKPVNSSSRIIGDPPEATLLRQVMSGVTPGVIVSATLGADPSFTPVEKAQIPTGLTWIYFSVLAAAGDPVTQATQDWLSSLVAGAYKDEAAGQGFPHLDGFSVRGADAAGNVDPSVGGDFRIGLGASEPITTASPAVLEADISQRLKTTPFKLLSFSVETPDHNAPVVVVQSDSSDVVGGSIDLSTIFGDPFQFEGFYLQIDDSNGKPLRIYSQSSRTQISGGWIVSSLLPKP